MKLQALLLMVQLIHLVLTKQFIATLQLLVKLKVLLRLLMSQLIQVLRELLLIILIFMTMKLLFLSQIMALFQMLGKEPPILEQQLIRQAMKVQLLAQEQLEIQIQLPQQPHLSITQLPGSTYQLTQILGQQSMKPTITEIFQVDHLHLQ